MTRDTGFALMIGGSFVLLVLLAVFMPSNMLSGRVVEETCTGGECLQLCDVDTDCDLEGAVCCATEWESGVCGVDCAQINEYSKYQSLELYQDTISDKPPAVHAGLKTFFLPLLLVLALVAYFVLQK